MFKFEKHNKPALMQKILLGYLLFFGLTLFVFLEGKTTVAASEEKSVQTKAIVDPSLTVVVGGISNGNNFNSFSSFCPDEKANSGTDSTATHVNLGELTIGSINKTGQIIQVSTNAPFGYAITATSSGKLMDKQSRSSIADANGGSGLIDFDSPEPSVFPLSDNAAFGLSPCGQRVPSIWNGRSAIASGEGARLSNPWNTETNSFYATLASFKGGVSVSETTVVRYAATVSPLTPGGIYATSFTYMITPVF